MDLKGYQRSYLTRMAHSLQPVVMIGKGGLSATVIKALDEALEAHEIIKVKFQDHQDERKDLARQAAQEVQAVMVKVIGHVAILYRHQEDPQKRVVHLPK